MVTSADIDRLRSIVAQRLGLIIDDSSSDHLAEVLRQRICRTGSGNAASYFDRLGCAESGAAETRELANELTVGETYFFRNPAQLRAFAEIALPQRLAERNGQTLRILSAGCASGEEPYSLAALAKEALAGKKCLDVRITGVDVSPALLAKAAGARYSEWSLRTTSPEQRQRHFRMQGREYLLDEAIRAMVTFQARNLLEDDPGFWRPEEFDIIFFRNVTIYFAPATTKAVIARMTRSLAPGGFLFLGPTETLRGVSNDFHLLHTHDAFYYKRRRPGEAQPPTGDATMTASVPADLRPCSQDEPDRSWVEAIRRAAERVAAVTQRRCKVQGPDSAPVQRPQPQAVNPQPWDLGPAQEMLRQERFEEAMAALGALPAESAADADALLLRAAVLTNKGSVTEAERVCRQVLQVDELNAGAHYLLALCREHLGARHAAAEHDQMAIYLDPAFAMPRLHLGMMTKRCGDLSTARRELQQALLLLELELSARILLFGGGFSREALMQLCRAELRTCGGSP